MVSTEIVQCIGDATQIAVALATAKRQPPRDATVALDRLLSRLNAMVVIPDLATPAPEPLTSFQRAALAVDDLRAQVAAGNPEATEFAKRYFPERGEPVPPGPDDLEELDPEPEEIAAAARFDAEDRSETIARGIIASRAAKGDQVAKATLARIQADDETEALAAQIAAVQAEIARLSKPAKKPVLAPSACRPEPAQTRHVKPAAPQVRAKAAKQREPRLPTVAEIVPMLARVIVLKPDAAQTKGKQRIPVDLATMAERWLTEERRYRKTLRERAVWDPAAREELLARTPERICAVDMTQDPATVVGSMEAYDKALAEQKREQQIIADLDREIERKGKKLAWGERAVWERDLDGNGSCRGCGQDYHHRHGIKCKCLNE